ncbi:MAG TPA: T9SS type A sorting domain-containing protein [Flavobacterium sp.]|jgi:hypothetical protein|nr:T9SS type A sorting domain-containing protein [Flavobacterium sp.]HRZ74072.1 T9SS type A sorting domain-containing protein [Flavobacterium sp.]
MKKITLLFFALILAEANAQVDDVSPNLSNNSFPNYSSLFNPYTTEFLYDIGSAIGTQGNAGVLFLNNQFWVSAWASSNIHVLNNSGGFVETFTVAGVTGARSLTTDGTNVYVGANNTNIYVINPITKTLINTITTTTTSGINIRFLTYDATLNGNAGGFWIGNFNTDIVAVDMSGNQINVIPATTHGLTGMYGAAVNSATNTLFVYNQSAPSNDIISSISLSTGAMLVNYDVFANDLSSNGVTSSLAGGTFLSSDIVPGQTILIGVSQATPSNILWGININNLLSTTDLEKDSFKIYPNPVNNLLHFSTTNFDEITIFNIDGKIIKSLKSNSLNDKTLDVSNLSKGVYIISVKSESNIKYFKIVKV